MAAPESTFKIKNYWIFQGNVKRWPWAEKLVPGKIELWEANQRYSDMAEQARGINKVIVKAGYESVPGPEPEPILDIFSLRNEAIDDKWTIDDRLERTKIWIHIL